MENVVSVDIQRATDLAEAQMPVLLVKNAPQYPELMTKEELIEYLRIPQVSKAKDYNNVIENLRRMHGLPSIKICRKPLYPKKWIDGWIEEKTEGGL